MATSLRNVRGLTRLGFDSVAGLVDTVERMHETIARHPLPFMPRPAGPTRARGLIASGIYSIIRGVNVVVREGTDLSLRTLYPQEAAPRTARNDAAWISAVNGVCGDHLEDTSNPLAITMGFSTPEVPLEPTRSGLAEAVPAASPRVAVFVHGLCMSPYSWWRASSPSAGDRLRDELGWTPVYLHYNSGRHIATNGRDLAEQLERLCAAWPVPVESLSLIGHSMGGLVIRSACHYAGESGRQWLDRLDNVVCLGTPHHGSALEKAGSLVDRAAEAIQYTEPLMLGRKRSAGIRDLRHGNLLDEDRDQDDPRNPLQDPRRPVPLLDDVDYYFVAAAVGRHEHDPASVILGDFLVRLGSATGAHNDELRRLHIRPENCRVFPETSHMDLLSDEGVHRQLIRWFGGDPSVDRA